MNKITVKNKGISQMKKPSPLHYEEMALKKMKAIFYF